LPTFHLSKLKNFSSQKPEQLAHTWQALLFQNYSFVDGAKFSASEDAILNVFFADFRFKPLLGSRAAARDPISPEDQEY
jgi:hypothetical protein